MKKSKIKKEKIKILVSWVVVIGLLITGSFAIWFLTLKIPDLGSFEGRKVTESTKIYDRTGEVLLFDIYNEIKRTVVSLEEISDNLKKATIAIEDAEFYEHKGVKPTAVLRAILINIGSL